MPSKIAPARAIGKTLVAGLARLCLVAACTGIAFPALAQNGPQPRATPALDGIFAAFQTHPLVGIADAHTLAQELDFYAALIRDPRFATEVGNVVVEFGGAAHQDIIDQYVAGKAVTYTDLRKVWTDVVGWTPTVTGLGYMNFFAQVRERNRGLAPERQIHVWLGEPAIDWTRIQTRQDWQRIAGYRDMYPAELIRQQILAKNKKSLVIYGGGHFGAPEQTAKALEEDRAAMEKRLGAPQPLQLGLQTPVEQAYPKAFFIVTPYTGYSSDQCTRGFERDFSDWKSPALIGPIQGTALESALRRPGCTTDPRPSGTSAGDEEIFAKRQAKLVGLGSDALLYLGPVKTLTRTPTNPDLYLDTDYRSEVSRHFEILSGRPLGPAKIEDFPASPRPWR